MHNIANKYGVELVNDILGFLTQEKSKLVELNVQATSDTKNWIEDDYKYVCSYLKQLINDDVPSSSHVIKPKGNILIILSYNEPFILSIIPVICALIVGNNVTVKPSKLSERFFRYVWQESGLVKKYNLKLSIITSKDNIVIETQIKNSQSVYFFGGYSTARKIYNICAKYFVEFVPEIETSDFKVVNFNTFDNKKMAQDIENTVVDAFSHAGQSCQRIQGVFVKSKIFSKYKELLKDVLLTRYETNNLVKHISHNFKLNDKYKEKINKYVQKANAKEILILDKSKGFPLILIEPKTKSSFVTNAFFAPTMWVASYKSYDSLIESINDRIYRMGINISTDDNQFLENLIADTMFTRYTVNRKHTDLGTEKGWGGAWPSGYRGFRNWTDIFSNPSVVINNNRL